MKDFRNKSVNVHDFAMNPSRDVPRSVFNMEHVHKTTLDAGYLIPIYWDMLMPGDTYNISATIFARLSTPLVPVMDNLHLDVQWMAVPIRIIHANFKKLMGEQINPADSISFSVPQVVSPAGGYTRNTIFDYLGLPTIGQVAGGNTVSHSAYPLRAYNAIWNQWYRDENLQNSVLSNNGDGPDTYTDYALLRRGKRKDYFTSGLPWSQKGNPVAFPLGTSAPVYGTGKALGLWDGTSAVGMATEGTPFLFGRGTNYNQNAGAAGGAVPNMATNKIIGVVTAAQGSPAGVSGLYADLSSATAATINALRLAEFTQEFLEMDARGGTRYPELIYSHFKVRSPDARQQRPEFLGSSSDAITITSIPQTSATGLTGGTTPSGNLAAIGTGIARSGCTYSATEHCIIMGIMSIRADLTYQQGLRRQWSYLTRFDFPWPVFATLGEQSILNKEIYCDGSANDALTFAYQERYGECRYFASLITGFFRSTDATPLDMWHYSQEFASLPTLNATFIVEDPPVQRALAVASQTGKQFLVDAFFKTRAARPLPMFGVPSLGRRF